MTRRLTFLLGALSALCVALVLPPDLLLPGARADVTCSTVAMTCSAGATYTGGAITTPVLAPAADNCGAVPYSFSGDTTTGICSKLALYTSIRSNGVSIVTITPSQLMLKSTSPLGWSSGAPDVLAGDLFLYRDAANTLGLRNGTNAQTLNIYKTWIDDSNYQRGFIDQGVTTADALTLGCAKAGSPNFCSSINLNQNGSVIAAFTNQDWSGISDQTVVGGTAPLKQLGVNRAIQGSKTKALTEGAATAVTQIAVPQTAGANFADATVQWTVYATDGTDTQTRRGSTYLAAVNKAGTETCTVGDIGTPVVAVSAGTLTCTTSCVTGLTDAVQFALDCTSSLTQSTLSALVRLDMDQPNTVTPQ